MLCRSWRQQEVLQTRRRLCQGRKGAIVEIKNYEGTSLGKAQVDKTHKDMCALKDSMRCSQVSEARLKLFLR